jgi:hypothetical protein
MEFDQAGTDLSEATVIFGQAAQYRAVTIFGPVRPGVGITIAQEPRSPSSGIPTENRNSRRLQKGNGEAQVGHNSGMAHLPETTESNLCLRNQRSEVQLLSGAPYFQGSSPDTWATQRTGYIGNNLGPNGLSSGSSTRVSRSKYPRS